MSLARAAAVALLLALAALAARRAEACAVVPPDLAMKIAIDREEALIVWDAKAKVEHFIRRASFSSGDAPADFGFLVPTPGRPSLAEADDALFAALDETTRRVPSTQLRFRPSNLTLVTGTFALMSDGARAGRVLGAPQVRVLEEASVAGYQAAVLEADRPDALAGWLRDNGYPSRPALERWLAPYVAARYVVTAFKLASPTATATPGLRSRAVRLTFAAPRAFYPYREPDDTPPSHARVLRVFYVADGPAARPEHLDASGKSGTWHGALRYSRPLEAASATVVAAVGALLPAPPSKDDAAWLTEFVDTAGQRADADLFFARAEGPAAEVVPLDVSVVDVPPFPLPLEVIAPAVAFIVWRRRRARRTRSL